MTQPRLLDTPTGLRNAVVIGLGAGNPPDKTMTVRIEGVDEPQIILAPPKDVPLTGTEIAVRLHQQDGTRAQYWTYAGRGRA